MMHSNTFIPTLYYYEHCPYCIRVLTFAGLANISLEKVVLLNDDEQTPISMIGAKMLPILVTQPNTFMPESLDIIDYLSQTYHFPLASEPELRQQAETLLYEQRIPIYSLMMPRCIQLPLQEFKTHVAIDYFVNKKTAAIGDFAVAMENSAAFIQTLATALEQAADLFKSLTSKCTCDAAIILFSALYGLFYVKDFTWSTAAKNFMQAMGEAANLPVFEQACQAI